MLLRRHWLIGLMLCLPAGVLCAQGAGADERMDELDRRIEELRRQKEELERQAEEAERAAEQAEWFKDIKAESAERLQNFQAELEEMRREEPDEDAPRVHRELRKAQMVHLQACIEIDQKIVALEGPAQLPEAVRLQREREIIDTKWWMVSEPKYGGAAEIAEMAAILREQGNPPPLLKMLEQLKAVHKQNVDLSERLYQLWVEREEAMAKFHQMVDEFWKETEQAEKKAEELELPD